MTENYIVLRNSPEWLSFDLEASRAFCKWCGLPESMVIDFAAHWDAAFAVGYRQMRYGIKKVSLDNFASVRGASVMGHETFRKHTIGDDALIVFVDDDDWLAPDLFGCLRAERTAGDGFKWGSVRLGRIISNAPNAADTKLMQLRPFDRLIYTNNYAISGAALRRLGFDALFDHGSAQGAFDTGRFIPQTIAKYLTCANKHPVSTSSARFLLTLADFRRDPRDEIERFARGLTIVTLEPEFEWIRLPLQRLHALFADALMRPGKTGSESEVH